MSDEKGFLAVDCGNSRIKVVRYAASGDTEPEVRVFLPTQTDALIDWIEELRREGEICGVLSVVGNLDARLTESLRRVMGERLLVLTPATDLPVRLGYRTPQTLGLDRKATACAAVARYPDEKVLVIDAGTAVTIDMVTPDGEFIGGNISPGLRLRFRSLHDFTARLPLIEEATGDFPEFGFDTPSAIKSGVIGGWIDEMAAVAVRCAKDGRLRVLLTGGDSPLAARLLPERIRTLDAGAMRNLEIEHSPHLLAEGLRAIYRHHENEN